MAGRTHQPDTPKAARAARSAARPRLHGQRLDRGPEALHLGAVGDAVAEAAALVAVQLAARLAGRKGAGVAGSASQSAAVWSLPRPKQTATPPPMHAASAQNAPRRACSTPGWKYFSAKVSISSWS